MTQLGPGSVLDDRYRLEAEIGRGGMGRIYRAHDLALERVVAVKVLSPSDIGTAGRARLLNEAQAAAQLNHPNIVTIHDVGEADGAPFIVMEHVEGASLHDKSPTSIPDLIRLAAQVCTALEHAHSHGIVHRDLKPENILVAPDGTAKLTDFGLALSLASRTTSEGAIAGTVFYLAPEQALGQPLDGRTDLYALGVILYELAAGRLPFVAEDPLAVVSQHLYTPVVLPTTYNDAIPPALEGLILHLMAKQPDDRPASAAEVRIALLAIDTSGEPAASAEATSLLDRIVRGRLAGRDDELKQARSAWQQAAAGRSQILLISGEPGVGKTRLSRELAAQASVSGGTVLIGECFADAGAPYAPISQMILQAVDGRGPMELGLPEFVLADLMTLAPPLRARHSEIPPNPPTDPQAEQQRLSESVVLLMASLSQMGPVLILLEDAHWADGATLGLLRHLAHHAGQHSLRLLAVLTYREVELDDARALHETLLDLNRQGLARRIKLTRLTREQTKDMLAVLFQEEITDEFLDGIYHETEGNPFFIEEVCKALIEGGMLWREGGRWRRPDMSEVEVPQSIRVAIQARLARLPEATQEVLTRASILGREFEYELLREVCDLDEDTLIDALEIAEGAQLIEEIRQPGAPRSRSSPRFRFSHALIPHTLAEGVSGLRRQRLHRGVAEALERMGADRLDELAPRIGRHFTEAGDWDRAVEYLLRAGDRAQSIYAYQEAIAAYEQALGILREQKDKDREARTLMKLGSLYHSLLDFPRSRRAYQDGFALWQRTPAPTEGLGLNAASRPLRLANGSLRSVDPAFATYVHEFLVVDELLAGLVERTPEMDIVPDIAASWEVQDGGHRYVFRLRDDAHWSDGVPVHAADFEIAWKRILDPAGSSPNARFLFDLKGARAYHRGEGSSADDVGVRALDERTLRIDLEAPRGYFLHLLATPTMYAIPSHVFEVKGNDWIQPENFLSCGPFLLEAWRTGELMVFRRNPDYHGRFRGNVHRVEMPLDDAIVPARDLELYEANEVDICGFPEERAAELRHRYSDQYVTVPWAATAFIWFDMSRPPFSDGRVRRALVHACDRERLAHIGFQGLVLPATGGLVPVGLPGHVEGIALPYDLETARSLLAEAGYPEGAGFPTMDMLAPLSARDSTGFADLVSQWRELGIAIKVDSISAKEFEERFEKDRPMMCWTAWVADYPDPDSFLRIGLSYRTSTRWNPEYHDLVAQAAQATKTSTRMDLYGKAERLLIGEAVVMPAYYYQAHLLMKPWVKKYPMSPVRYGFWKDTVLEDE